MKTVLLKDLCENFQSDIVDGPFGSNLKKEHYKEVGYPVLKIQNIKLFSIIPKKLDYVDEKKYVELKRHSFQRGDIIMTKLGSPLGVCAIVEDYEAGLIVADLVRIRPKYIDTQFLCYYLNSATTRNYINSKQKGATRPRVKLNIVRDLPIPLPSMDEQIHVVEKLNQAFIEVDCAEVATLNKLQAIATLRESLISEFIKE